MATELIGIELQLRGEEGVFRDLQKLDNMLKGFGGAKGKKAIELDLGQSKQRLLELRGEINKTVDEIAKLKKKMADLASKAVGMDAGSEEFGELADSIEDTAKKLDNAEAHLKEVKTEFKDVTLRVNELNHALRNFAQMSWGQMFTKISTGLKHMGQNMQTLGNALTKIGTPFASITQGMLYGAGYKLLNGFTEGLENGFTRYDTMKKYPKIMAAFGYSAEEAEKSVNALDLSVRGLPTGLDEMVDLAQRFTATTGDIEKGTKLAIATNNAFLASMSTDTQRYQGMMQLQDVLGGKDMNAREWNSLVSSMTPAIVKMGEAMIKSGEFQGSIGDFIQMIRDGKMDNQEFIDQLIKIGNKGGALEAMAQESKNTWQAFFANIRNASARMTAGILKSLDEISQAVAGKDVNQLFADNIIPWIDKTTKSIQKWIKANPDKILDFFERIKNIDYASIGKGIIRGLNLMLKAVEGIMKATEGWDLSWLATFITLASPAGKAITLLGGLLKGLSHPLGAILATIAKFALMFKGDIGKKGIFEALGRIFGGKKGMKGAEEVAAEIPTFSNTLRRSFKSLEGIITGAGAVLTVSGTAFVAFKAVKSVLKDLGEIMDIAGGINWNKGIAAFAIIGSGVGGLAWVFNKLGTVLGKDGILATAIGGLATIIVSGSVAADMRLLKDGLKSFSEMLDMIAEIPGKLKAIKKIRKGDRILGNLSNVVETLNSVSDVLNGEDIGRGTYVGGLKPFRRNKLRWMKNISEFVTLLNGTVEDMNKLNKADIQTDNLENIKARVEELFKSLAQMYIAIPSRFKGKWGSEDYGYIANAVQHTADMFENIKSLMTKMHEVFDILDPKNTSDLFANNVAWNSKNRTAEDFPITQRLKPLFEEIQQIQDMMRQSDVTDATATSFAKKMQNFARGFRSMVKVFTRLQQIELFSKRVRASANGYGIPGMTAVRGLLTQLEGAFRTDRMDSINSQISGFVEQINSLIDTISKISVDTGNLNIEIHISNHIFGLEETLLQIRNINTQVRQAINGIQTYYKKTITVDISTSGMRMYDSSLTGHGIHDQMGGLIYRAGGGSIFKPRGTDTVPAMLTPGEFVQRKQAVDFFGADFMRKVNNLDVRGAMHDLLTRAGSMTQNTRQSIVNNTVNNNQRVNMTVNSDNPETIKIRMSRFAGAF